jgi:hypothetical protein
LVSRRARSLFPITASDRAAAESDTTPLCHIVAANPGLVRTLGVAGSPRFAGVRVGSVDEA